jgi:putative transposase
VRPKVLATVVAARDLLGTDIQELIQRAVPGRCGAGARPDAPMQWLSDNGSIYTALDTLITAKRLHLVPITTPRGLSPAPTSTHFS